MLSQEELAHQYLRHIEMWCIRRKAKRKQAVKGAPSPRAFDVLQAQAVMDAAKRDLDEKHFNALKAAVEHYRSSSMRGGQGEAKLPPTAWSMYYEKCILCKSTKRRHYRGGKCTGCWRATHELRDRVRALQRVSTDNSTIEET